MTPIWPARLLYTTLQSKGKQQYLKSKQLLMFAFDGQCDHEIVMPMVYVA